MATRRWIGIAIAISLLSTVCGACSTPQTAAHRETGVQHRTLKVEGVDYQVTLFFPDNAGDSPLPVVLVFHGGGGTGDRALQKLKLQKLAEEKHFIIVAPWGQNKRWLSFGEPSEGIDFHLCRDLLDMVPSLGGDPKRVYAIGFSNGGFMAQVIGALYGDRIAAIGAGGSSIGRIREDFSYHENPRPKRPIPVMLFHGMLDPNVGYDMSRFSVSAPDSLVWWARQDGLAGPPVHEELANGDVMRDAYEGAAGLRTVLMSFKKLGHDWPIEVDAETGMNFNDELWKFLSQYSLKQ